MTVTSIIEDSRIKSINILVEFSIREYLSIADEILHNNPFQRKRVKSSSTVYSLLRDDLKAGCVIPPIVLAITDANFNPDYDVDPIGNSEKFQTFLNEHLGHVIILDGLQRTYNVIDANSELMVAGEADQILIFHTRRIRCEFYIAINKIGVLYRMLTLNTGQTPMSLRHQIEILYSDYLDHPMNGILLLREIDEKAARNPGEYSFKDIIDGFTSYLTRDYLQLDRSDILGNIKSLEKLSKETDPNIFKDFLNAYHQFQVKMQEIAGDWEVGKDWAEENQIADNPYGTSAKAIFDKPQTVTAFGAAIGFLFDRGLLDEFAQISNAVSRITFKSNVENAFNNLLFKLEDIRKNAPKIGNAQRAYFFYFFRELFNPEGDSYLVIDEAVENAFKRYRQNA